MIMGRRVFVLLLLAAAVAAAAAAGASDAATMTPPDLGLGYNIAYASPPTIAQTDTNDAGFRRSAYTILDLAKTAVKRTPDPSTKTKFQTQRLATSSQLAEAYGLRVSVGASGNVGGVRMGFRASASYKYAELMLNQRKKTLVGGSTDVTIAIYTTSEYVV